MKRLFSLLTLALLCITASAQQSITIYEFKAPYQNFFSTRMGVNFSNLYNDTYSSDCQVGFNVAALYNISLLSDAPLYLQSGLAIEMKGARNTGLLGADVKSHFKSYNLQIPVVVTYDMPIGMHTALIPELGLYYSYAFTGSLSGDDIFLRPYKSQEIAKGNETISSKIFHRSDFGLRVGLNFRYCRCLVGFAYDAGLINSYAKDLRDLDISANSGSWSINMGYRF